MPLVNPVYTFVVPFLLVVTAPLAIFAGITTVLAFSVLSLRVVVVYLDIALSLVPQCFTSRLRPPASSSSSSSSSWLSPWQKKERHGASSQNASPVLVSGATNSSSCNSTPTATPLWQQQQQQSPLLARTTLHSRRPSSAAASIVSATSTAADGSSASASAAAAAAAAPLGLVPSVGPERDFEGIGGWRAGRNAADDDDDADAWTTFNSRFEFPDRSHPRSRHRSPCTTPGDGGVLMMRARARSPGQKGPVTPPRATSRPPTPSASRVAAAATDSYFPLAMSPAATKRPTS
ncbi:hypothetical protein CDD81_4232 [Ophiocordyceps australis]|uniref:Uncharacterized protein n=1 Tax=Ophiocordyceps australis TaxID=1399860 RepID=A0A2C5YCL8_9HYPO|nr:hypothetical protein CDD81_4232 [Ophiocordyceps australis]